MNWAGRGGSPWVPSKTNDKTQSPSPSAGEGVVPGYAVGEGRAEGEARLMCSELGSPGLPNYIRQISNSRS